jgi:uncharacterized membrane protein YfcA
MRLLIFAAINFLTSMLSGAAGGGGALISNPVLVLLGLSPATAIATTKFSGLGISSGTSLRFFREKLTDKRSLIIFSVVSGFGAIIGSLLLVKLSAHEQLLQDIMGLTILAVGIPLLYIRNLGVEAKARSRKIQLIGTFLLFLSVVFQAALGSGLGSLQLIVLIGCFGMTALVASATRRAMQLTVAVLSLIVLMLSGLVNYKYGVISFITALIGGYCGAHIAIKKGNRFVINLFAVTSAILALQLIWHW